MFLKFKPIYFLSLLCLFLSCNGNKATTGDPSQDLEKIAFTILVSGSHSNFEERTESSINSQEELQSVFNTINSTRKPGIEVPTVDFDKNTVFFYSVGQLSYGGAPIEIETIEKTETNVQIIPRNKEIDPSQPVTTVLSSPFVMIEFKKQELPVVIATKK